MDATPILICYDGSDDARRAIDAAASLLGPRPAVVLGVAERATVAEGLVANASMVPRTGFQALHESEALQAAKAGAEHANSAGFAAEPRTIVASRRWEGIVEVADEIDAAAIVMGSGSQSGLQELAEGSLWHDVAAHARRPVLLVPAPGAQPRSDG